MSTFLERLKNERNELREKHEKLNSFIMTNPAFNDLDDIQSILLKAQYHAMTTYLFILNQRLIELNK